MRRLRAVWGPQRWVSCHDLYFLPKAISLGFKLHLANKICCFLKRLGFGLVFLADFNVQHSRPFKDSFLRLQQTHVTERRVCLADCLFIEHFPSICTGSANIAFHGVSSASFDSAGCGGLFAETGSICVVLARDKR